MTTRTLTTTRPARRAAAGLLTLALAAAVNVPARGAWVWVEGEKAERSSATRHPWYHGSVRRDLLSGGDFLSHFDERRPAEASYRVAVPADGTYEFWVRANPVQAKLSYRLDAGAWAPVPLERDARDSTNVAADGKPDLRFLAWVRAGDLRLTKGTHALAFRMDSANSNHGAIDCFVLTTEPFTPGGTLRPDQLAAAARRVAAENAGWFPFTPPADRFKANPLDLRGLNEPKAGDGGFIAVKGGKFVHSDTGKPVRFWAVNGPPGKDAESLRRDAKVLARRGVNLVRVHHGYYSADKGEPDKEALLQAHDVVEAMKAEGIYSYFSIYFPLWLTPSPDNPFLKGYDGRKHPFAALMFDPDFQARYHEWWKALLLTPHPKTGRRLVDDPAVAGVEVQNEDSFFFWTFNDNEIPDPELRRLEAKFGEWVKKQYGSFEVAYRKWDRPPLPRDRPGEGRLAFRPLWNMANEKSARDRDTARFLAETQRTFYRDTYRFLRNIGFKGVVTASNWTTASAEVLTPIEKYTYTVTDFVDRHGYFGCLHKGDSAEWSVRDGHTYADRSALRFDPEEPGKPKVFGHPANDPHYDGKPSMVSETTFNRPNRFRSEAPLYYAAYGALQGSDAVVHFALDTTSWSVKPNFYMQPWTLMTPAMMGQFPAAAVLFRKGLVGEGDVLADLNLPAADVVDLKGTPLPQDAALDELRLKDVPAGGGVPRAGQVIDPLIYYAGRTAVRFSGRGGPSAVKDLRPYVDRARRTVTSTNGHLRLDYGKGLLTVNAPSAQGLSGALREAGMVELADLSVGSSLELGHVVAVALDDRPLSTSSKILLQVMSEEKATGFQTADAPGGLKKIVSIGRDPWLVREFDGVVRFKRKDAASLKVTALDPNGDPLKSVVGAADIRLGKSVLYYVIEPSPAPATTPRR